MKGKKSEATKRRERLVQQGLLAPPVKDATKSWQGTLGAIATHGPEILANHIGANVFVSQDVISRRDARTRVAYFARGSALECAEFLRDLALGRNGFEDAPIRERRQAAGDVLALAGVSLQQGDDELDDERSLCEYSAAELQRIIEQTRAEINDAEALLKTAKSDKLACDANLSPDASERTTTARKPSPLELLGINWGQTSTGD